MKNIPSKLMDIHRVNQEQMDRKDIQIPVQVLLSIHKGGELLPCRNIE